MKKILLFVFALGTFAAHSQWLSTPNVTGYDCIGAFGNVLASDMISGGLNVSTDQGATWTSSNTGVPAAGLNFGTYTAGSLYAYRNNTVYVSTTGNNWSSMTSTMASSLIIKSMTSISGSIIASASPNSPVSFKIFQLNGASWAQKSAFTGSIVTCIRNLNGTLFAGTTASSVIKSTDAGMTFTTSSTGMPPENGSKYINCLGSTASVLFAGTAGGKICRSVDAGANWSTVYNIGDGVSFIGINEFYMYSNNDIFAATDSGFVYSNNAGVNWTRYNTGLNFANSENLMTHVTVVGSYIIATVKTSSGVGSKVVRRLLNQIVTTASLNENSLAHLETKVYPNPASHEAYVEVADLQFESNCEIKLFDALGREVALFALNEGKAQLNLENYKSGLYSFTVFNNKAVVSRGKLVVN